jgi:hypothetical protein
MILDQGGPTAEGHCPSGQLTVKTRPSTILALSIVGAHVSRRLHARNRRHAMRRILLSIAVLTLWLTAGANPASAQIKRFKVTLPFNFQVGETSFEKGTYIIQQEANQNLIIRADKGTASGSFAAASLPHQSAFEPPKTWLVFHRYGDKHFLSEIWSRHIGVEMPRSSAEKRLMESGEPMVSVRADVR